MRLIWILSCGSASEPDMMMQEVARPAAAPAEPEPESAGPGGLSSDADEGFRAMKEEGRVGKSDARMDKAMGDRVQMEKKTSRDEEAPADDAVAQVETRSWFPETFVWAPVVLTDESGHASVDVTVPDTLTTWRVLGLAASQDGAQAGDVHTFQSGLPVYVEPRVPEVLRQGDRVEVPVRVVNTTEGDVTSKLSVRATGLDGSAVGTITVPAGTSVVESVTLTAVRPGAGTLEAGLEGADALVKPVRVEPTGRPLTQSRSGLFGGASSFDLETPAGSEYARLSLTVFPGPLGVLRRELDTSGGGGSLFDAAYAMTLGASGGELLSSLAAEPSDTEQEALRALRLRAQQRLVSSELHATDIERAAILQAAVLAPDDAVAERLSTRARGRLRQDQLGDGSWTTPQGTTLQEFLVRTAWICAAVEDPGTTVRCGAVFERNAQHLLDEKTADAYTAAMVLRSGAGSDELRAALSEIVHSAVGVDGQGRTRVELPEGVRRPDGSSVTALDALAAATHAYEAEGVRPLAAAVVSAYDKRRGFGDGQSGLLALEAVARVGVETPPEEITVKLLVDGEVLEEHTLRGEALQETVVLTAEAPRAGAHAYSIEADHAMAGLAWHLDLQSWVPWDGESGPEGLEIEVEHGDLAFGRTTHVAVTAAVPKGASAVIRHEPPVGFVVDRASITGGTIRSVDDSGIEVAVRSDDGIVQVEYLATPTLRGSLHTGPATVALASAPDLVKAAPPEVWTLK